MKSQDVLYMQEALSLAKKGLGNTFPNPMVGAILVKNGEIIGKGYHKKAGLPHAEIEALHSLTENPRGATLYVTLEPCSHHGRTPPCVDVLIKSGIKKVIYAIKDPNPNVCGKGIEGLLSAGIQVEGGLLENGAKRLNESFFTFHIKHRPFIAIKFAASLDGKIATKTGDSKWITNEKAREFSRKLRLEYQAILMGINTIIHDNPHLGVRIKNKHDPLRVVLDSTLKIPLKSLVLRDNNILIITTIKANKKKLQYLQKRGIDVVSLSNEKITVPEVLKELKKREIISVFVEGGGKVLGSFVDAKIVDKVYAFHSPIIIGGRNALSAISGEGVEKISQALPLTNIQYKRFDTIMLTVGDCSDELAF